MPLDPKVAPLVQELEETGFTPYMSCQGGRGHSEDFEPRIRGNCWISFLGEEIPDIEDVDEVKQIIQKHSKAPVKTIMFTGQADSDFIPEDQLFFITKRLGNG